MRKTLGRRLEALEDTFLRLKIMPDLFEPGRGTECARGPSEEEAWAEAPAGSAPPCDHGPDPDADWFEVLADAAPDPTRESDRRAAEPPTRRPAPERTAPLERAASPHGLAERLDAFAAAWQRLSEQACSCERSAALRAEVASSLFGDRVGQAVLRGMDAFLDADGESPAPPASSAPARSTPLRRADSRRRPPASDRGRVARPQA